MIASPVTDKSGFGAPFLRTALRKVSDELPYSNLSIDDLIEIENIVKKIAASY